LMAAMAGWHSVVTQEAPMAGLPQRRERHASRAEAKSDIFIE
jgi:hypothetical protein